MLKTQIFIVCDKCEKSFIDADEVWGYVKYDNQRITAFSMNEKNYTDYYFDEECYNKLKTETLEKLKKTLTAAFVSKVNTTATIYVPYIGESYTFHVLDFDEVDAIYFYIEVDGHSQLVKVRYYENDYYYSCFNNAIDLMFKNMKRGRLIDLRREFKEEGNRRKLASQMASSAACSAFDSISGDITTEIWG